MEAKKKHSLTKTETQFVKTVWDFHRVQGRHELPWRQTNHPYKIVVSELMLQQTQVARVLLKYKEFLKAFKTTRDLATAPLGEVLTVWQGLGYNRRAKFLWVAAQEVQVEYRGAWPKTFEELKSLPGIGSYTAGAVMNFAYNEPYPLIETNVRTAYLHHFFKDSNKVSDTQLLPIIERTLDRKRPQEWNWALMDYGAHLKATVGNVNRKSKSYTKQSNFKESNRYVRGAIVRVLSEGPNSRAALFKKLSEVEKERVSQQLGALLKEEMIVKDGQRYKLP